VKSVVIDAGVAVKWLPLFAWEPYSAEAQVLLAGSRRKELSLLVPDLFWPEVSSVLCKAVRRQACSAAQAELALAAVQEQGLLTVATFGLTMAALGVALRYSRSIYDSVYVALALSANCDMITADEKLANALATRLPVRWLGSL
jgi:predicted nucleic acid-binding protein